MKENLYTIQKKKGFIVTIMFGKIFMWAGTLLLINILTGGTCIRNAVECTLHSPLAMIYILTVIFACSWRDIRKILDVPWIMITDTVLIFDFGQSAVKWEDISRINIYKSNILIHKKPKFFRREWEPITRIENRSEIIGDLKRRCAEKNIPITWERSWYVFYY